MPAQYLYPIYILLSMVLNLLWFARSHILRTAYGLLSSLLLLLIVQNGSISIPSLFIFISNISLMFKSQQPQLTSWRQGVMPLLIGFGVIYYMPPTTGAFSLVLLYAFWYPLKDQGLSSWAIAGELLATAGYLGLVAKQQWIAAVLLLLVWKIGQFQLIKLLSKDGWNTEAIELLRG